MRIFQVTTVATPLALLLFLMGCSSAPDATTDGSFESETVLTAVNTNCPIMGGSVTDEGGRTKWNGQTIGFCCPDCIDQWNQFSEEEKTVKLAEASDEGSVHN